MLSHLTRRFLCTSRAHAHTASVHTLAVIDDHLNTSASHFRRIASPKLQVTIFNDTILPTTPSESERLTNRLRDFEIISSIRERTKFPASLLEQLPKLKLLLVTGTQFEEIDLAAARRLGIVVVAAPGGSQNIKKGSNHPTTQHTWALIMALARNVPADDRAMKSGSGWQSDLAVGLSGLTIGIVGLGRLGAAVARVASLAWGMKVICWSENLTQDKADEQARLNGLPLTVEGQNDTPTFKVVSKEELFKTADVVSLHYVLSARSKGVVGKAELDLMKRSAMLVNTSRGPLIDQDALHDTLNAGKIRGAALDVFELEPLPKDSPWRQDNYWGKGTRSALITTPHMGYVDEVLMNNWYSESAENADRWINGRDLLHRIA